MNIGDFIKSKRKGLNLTQTDVANKVGVNVSTISRYESGEIEKMPLSVAQSLAEILGIDPMIFFLMISGDSDVELQQPSQRYIKINVYGSVPAGIPLEAVEDVVGHKYIPEEMTRGGKEFIGLRVKGMSMYPAYQDGDTIIVQLQDDCESGQDVVIYVNGYDATLKTLIKNSDGTITLKPVNPEYAPHDYGPNDDPVKLLGVVRELRRSV